MASSHCVGSWEMISWLLEVKRIWGTTSQSLQLYLIWGCPLDIWKIKSCWKSLAPRSELEIHFWKWKTYGWYLKSHEERIEWGLGQRSLSTIGFSTVGGLNKGGAASNSSHSFLFHLCSYSSRTVTALVSLSSRFSLMSSSALSRWPWVPSFPYP